MEEGRVVGHSYIEHRGDIRGVLAALDRSGEYADYDLVGVTGVSTRGTGGVFDKTLSVIEGIRYLLPESRNIFAVGGESYALIFMDDTGGYREHSVNPPCAAGTGSFIEQQAERLGCSVHDLAAKAVAYEGKTPLIATRCAVFAKTDIIHSMQEGFSLDAVCAGLCEGIARNLAAALVKGRRLLDPVGMVGGVSLNAKIVETLGQVTGGDIVVPQYSAVAGAVGAARLAAAHAAGIRSAETRIDNQTAQVDSLADLADMIRTEAAAADVRKPLVMTLSDYPDFSAYTIHDRNGVEVFIPPDPADPAEGVYAGFDIGSTSTKAVLMASDGRVAGGFYTRTGGEPVKAVRRLIEAMDAEYGDGRGSENISLLGAGTTGSGRKMIKELFGADLEINEITAHAKAAVRLHPEVDTIIEIGGQDSKFTRVRGGEVYYSVMNYVCAAGTGSFIEEQAKRLGLGLDEFSAGAFGAEAPYTSDRCTVYMERDLSALLSEGWSKERLSAAVLHSVRDNYIAKVVNRSAVGNHVVFQGATARNAALVAGFEQLLGKPIHVSPYCHLTGALGAAMIAAEQVSGETGFVWNLEGVEFQEEICELCSNRCLLQVTARNGITTAWGMKCGREYSGGRIERTETNSPLKRFNHAMRPLLTYSIVHGTAAAASPTARQDLTIGIPKSLYNTGYAPLWYNFLKRLGYTPNLSGSSHSAIEVGREVVNSDFCAPMIAAHGYIKQLYDRGVDYIFSPAVINDEDEEIQEETSYKEKVRDAFYCYYSQYLPTIVGKLTAFDVSDRLIAPLVRLGTRTPEETARDIHSELVRVMGSRDTGGDTQALLPTEEETVEAFVAALEQYRRGLQELSKTYAKSIAESTAANPTTEPIRVVLLGRPYVVFDSGLNVGLIDKLESAGVEVYWQDEFDPAEIEPGYADRYYRRMHWRYGRRIVRLMEFAGTQRNLFPVYLTSFRCSPDSFLVSYLKDVMDRYDKPFLVLQLDEHASDVGYATRIEAGIHAFRNYLDAHPATEAGRRSFRHADEKEEAHRLEEGDTVLIPAQDRVICGFWTDAFIKAGYDARLLESTQEGLNTGYRHANGGECMPVVDIVGGAIKMIRDENLDPRKTFLYLPVVCLACNFPQFPIMARLAFQSAGLEGVKVGLINGLAQGDQLPQSLLGRILESNIIGSLLYKLYHRIRPYEVNPGDTAEAFAGARKLVGDAIRRGENVRGVLVEAIEGFRTIRRDESGGRKPRVGVLGDLYLRYNEVVNVRVQDVVDDLGGELVVGSLSEYLFHFYDADVRLYGENSRRYRLLKTIESRYEKMASDLIEGLEEPDFAECVELMEKYEIGHYIVGETSMNVGRALYFIDNGLVDAIIHLNPMFCCPGVVSASLFRKLQRDFGIPIIDLFYDGVGNPNSMLIPHLHYLREKS